MNLSIIAPMSYGTQPFGIQPGIDDSGKIARSPDWEDGDDIRTFKMDVVESVAMTGAGSSKTFFFAEPIPPQMWDVFVGDGRIGFQSPYFPSVFGKAKTKNRKVSAGHLPLLAINNLATFHDGGKSVLFCVCNRKDGSEEGVSFSSGNLDEMRRLLRVLHERVEASSRGLGNWLVPNDMSRGDFEHSLAAGNDSAVMLVDRWNHLPEEAWRNAGVEVSVKVPCKHTVEL